MQLLLRSNGTLQLPVSGSWNALHLSLANYGTTIVLVTHQTAAPATSLTRFKLGVHQSSFGLLFANT